MALSNADLGNYLRKLRETKQLSTREVYELCGVSNSYLSLVENGHRRASAIVLKKLAPIYNVDYLSLYEKAGYIDLIKDESGLRYNTDKFDELDNPVVEIPLLGIVKAGYDYLAQENWIGTVDVDKSLVNEGSDFFALKVHGNSMFPTLMEDDIVIIKKQDDFENGDIVVAIINGDEATIKKGKKSDTSILLQPLNNEYEPLIFTYDEMKSIPVTIIGVVKQLKREF